MTEQEKKNYEDKYLKQQQEISKLRSSADGLRNQLWLAEQEKVRLRKAVRAALKACRILSKGIDHEVAREMTQD